MMGRQALFLLSLACTYCSTWSYLTSVSSSFPRVPNLQAQTSAIRVIVSPRAQHQQSRLYNNNVNNSSSKRVVSPRAQHYSRLYNSNVNNNSSNNDKPNKRNPLLAVRNALTRFVASWTRFITKFRGLSRRAKLYVMTQFSIMLLVFGLFAKRTYVKYYPTATTSASTPPIEVPYSAFLDFSEGKQKDVKISNILIGPERIGFRLSKVNTEGKSTDVEIPQRMAYTRKVAASPELLQHLRQHNHLFSAAPSKTNYAAASLRTVLLAFYALLLLRMYRTMSGGGAGSNSPGKLATPSNVASASFNDIEGLDSQKFEVMELVDTLRNPDKYAILGARAPTGLLLEGPPGTGKTMLARATAATAGVPLLYCSGSDFVEMFVGRGAARVRKTFEKAAKLAPCIIFIDELDALGKSRDSGIMGMSSRGNDEAEQTLNQLLACMDGLDSSKRICVMAATNRKDVLDSALVRPGRFDRIIKLELPSTEGREKILRVHASKLPGFLEGSGIDDFRPGSLGKGRAVDLSAVASATPGLSGAELEFIVNEAAIRAVRRVSSELREGMDPSQIVPTVEAIDFEDSVRNFFDTRKNKGGFFRSLQK